jgi:hypothetical protein
VKILKQAAVSNAKKLDIQAIATTAPDFSDFALRFRLQRSPIKRKHY